jgi:hypothetical protein
MTQTKDARHAADFLGPRHDERKTRDGDAITQVNDTADEDEEALRLARAWREGKERVWAWWVERLNARLASGSTYASMRSFTDDVGQNHDFVDDYGRKVAVPHNRSLGRGLALLMVEEHPEFGQLFRMRKGAR